MVYQQNQQWLQQDFSNVLAVVLARFFDRTIIFVRLSKPMLISMLKHGQNGLNPYIATKKTAEIDVNSGSNYIVNSCFAPLN